MDETRKAATVAQLQELHAALPALIETAVGQAISAAIGGASAVFDQRIKAGEQSVSELRASMPPPQDLAPLIAVIQQNNQLLTQVLEQLANPIRSVKVGTATIGGETVTLRIAESGTEATH